MFSTSRIYRMHSCWHNPPFLMFLGRSPLSLLTAVVALAGASHPPAALLPRDGCARPAVSKTMMCADVPLKTPWGRVGPLCQRAGVPGRLWRWESSRRLKQHEDS